jgi:hypothetical protein
MTQFPAFLRFWLQPLSIRVACLSFARGAVLAEGSSAESKTLGTCAGYAAKGSGAFHRKAVAGYRLTMGFLFQVCGRIMIN